MPSRLDSEDGPQTYDLADLLTTPLTTRERWLLPLADVTLLPLLVGTVWVWRRVLSGW